MTEIETQCEDWSLNEEDKESENAGKCFWWNKTYSISVWSDQLNTKKFKSKDKLLDDKDVWRAYIEFQVNTVYKLCSICNGPETSVDMKVCCYCGSPVHLECAVRADKEMMAWKPANKGYEKYLVCCLACDDKMPKEADKRKIVEHQDDARRAGLRSLNIDDELGDNLVSRVNVVLNYPELQEKEKMREVQNINQSFFQPGNSARMLHRKPVPSKAGGLGVYALTDVPRFTIVGVYPGYLDPLSGEHAKCGRPGPRYSLVDLNCADYFNRVFVEFDTCFTPFINEPTPEEESNVAWIQETCHKKGRLSVMAVRDIKAGEELLIGYGPLYPRTYPYNYDAYALHQVDGYDDPPCFALWHWKTKEEKDAEFVCYVEYEAEKNSYTYWETEEEADERKKKEKGGGDNNKNDDAADSAESNRNGAKAPPNAPPSNTMKK